MPLPDWWKYPQAWAIEDCLEVMRGMPDKCVDLVLTDPPYYRIKKEAWDNQQADFKEYVAWIGECGREMNRILKDNGSLYIFGDEKNIAYVQVEFDKYFVLLNSMVWYKRNNISIKGAHNHRSFAPVSERFLFYGKGDKTGLQYVFENTECFTDIKAYMREERRRCMCAEGFKTLREFDTYINEVTGTSSVVSRHYFPDSQWVFPTKELYELMQTTGYWQRPYEELRREYEELRRVFNYQEGVYEVVDIPIIQEKENTKHPTTKPLSLFQMLVEVSSNPVGIVFDPFLGSGTTLLACRKTGRVGLGCEINKEYEPIIRKRCLANIPKITDEGWW